MKPQVTNEEIKHILSIHLPAAKTSDSLKNGIQGVLACIKNEDGSRELAQWFPLIDGRDTVHSKAKMFAQSWAEGDQPK